MSTILSSSETTNTSPTPISPFSNYSAASDATSDESPDLGAFTTVFRALNHLQPLVPPRGGAYIYTEFDTPSTDAVPLSSLPTDSEFIEGSTVWNQSMLASYLASSSSSHTRSALTSMTASPPLPNPDGSNNFNDSGEETEGELEPLTFTFTTPSRSQSHTSDADLSHDPSLSDGDIDLGDQPTLGDLGGAFSFLAAERARIAARDRGTGKDSSTSDGAWRNDAEPRRTRKRRRKKARVIQLLQRDPGNVEHEGTSHTTGTSTILGVSGTSEPITVSSNPEPEPETEESSSGDNAAVTIPSTPAHKSSLDRLRHSRSTPSLHLSQIPTNPQILKLRCLAHKLRLKFPEDYDRITALLTQDFSGVDSDFSDPRGPAPRPRDSLIHVFIDHSNILIGFLTYARRHASHSGRKLRLSHAALALLLERGRPITRRCLVTSSPLYQPTDTAEQLGYEVCIFVRVPDSGNGQYRRPPSANTSAESWRKGHARASSDSDKGIGGSGGTGLTASGSGGRNGRVRYREQGVDELLQLKLHQAIADADVPRPGATIVLATGDGNIGQFSDEGFLGPVRIALKKGWRVELYAWEDGLSRAWKKEFGEGTPWKDKFRIIKMEDFAEDLLEVE
ncbi:uncharacterized protein F5147DRAFT_618274 [Suillus discolor]|uniref:NYN domain-containing protein n=1 Tax=Suillus discolor TaxID=1912936 RepID=A0A9P7EXT0_9AGAM|nr:uncharacterized protein F5147DRAFT_618274 [Suillus discolor]KAG2096698.1 hypothetical protein F5147DRAFT_618274 [Suillus discolor]